MGYISKILVSILILLIATSSATLLIIQPTSAQSIANPPEFTVKFVDRSYDVPATYTNTTDPFTGQQITTKHGGYRVWNETIDVTVTNQAYRPVNLGNGNTVNLYYSVRTKGHYAADWNQSIAGYAFKRVLASTSEYTVITFILDTFVKDGGYYSGANIDEDELPKIQPKDLRIPQGASEDFQVKAELGYLYPVSSGHWELVPTLVFAPYGGSDWSDIQTLDVPYYVPTPTPSIPEFSAIALLPLFGVLAFTAIVILRNKRLYKGL